MGKRKRIALIFSYNENWIGGTYYIQNLIMALKSLEDEKMPEITICSFQKKDFDYIVSATSYPYLNFFKIITSLRAPIHIRALNVLYTSLFKKKIKYDKTNYLLPDKYDLVFPNPDGYSFKQIPEQKRVSWIPDFQEDYLSEFFSRQELAARKINQMRIAILTDNLVLSSQSAQSDFNRLYPFALCKQFVLPFAVIHSKYDDINIDELKRKYHINGSYFYCPNQFWIHKNHKIVIEAVVELKKQGRNITILFSGKENDYRNPDYVFELKKYVSDNEIEQQVLFLGFIDRKDQLILMKNALSIIQPSLFEGWSTVVEDAKAMSQFVIVSDLPVHKEQLSQNALFFERNNVNDLVRCINLVLENKREKREISYVDNIKHFGMNFLRIIESI